MTKERSGLLRLSMAFVEESDIGTYSLRVFNEHGEANFRFKFPEPEMTFQSFRRGHLLGCSSLRWSRGQTWSNVG